MMQLLSLEGRGAVVTGAASGIGRAIASRLAELGAGLVLVDRDEDGLRGTVERIASERAATPAPRTEVLDLTEQAAIRALWQRLDPVPEVLVNNAGSYPMQPFARIEPEDYRRVMSLNLDAVFWMSQEFVRRRGRQGGVIVNIASIEALLPFKDALAHYSTAKAGVIALTRAVAHEHAKNGFRANVIVPGGIDTPGTRKVASEVLRFRLDHLVTGLDFSRRLPLGRMGEPDDVARVVAFLASDASSYMTGTVVPVDGGFLSN